MTLDIIRRSPALRIGAGVLALWAGGAEAQNRITQDNRLITYELRPTPEGSGLDVLFRVELRDRNLRDPTGGRSLSGEAALNCAGGLTRLESMTVHAEPGLRGAVVQQVPRQTAWVRPEMGSLLRAIMISACKTPGAAGLAAALPVPRFAAPATPTAIAVAPSPARSPAPVTAPAPTRPSTSGAYRIQVGSFSSEAEARRHAARVRTLAAELAEGRLVAARVNGTTYHRVLIDGFADRAGAEAACRDLGARGVPCLVKSAPRGGR